MYKVLGCLFHMGQALFRRIQSSQQLNHRYAIDDDFRTKMRCFQSLAFVPPDEVYTFFCILTSSFDPFHEFLEFIMYFVRNWIGPSFIQQFNIIYPSPDGLNNGHQADSYVRNQLNVLGMWHLPARFPIALWNMTTRIV
jgi:hypothetical protein